MARPRMCAPEWAQRVRQSSDLREPKNVGRKFDSSEVPLRQLVQEDSGGDGSRRHISLPFQPSWLPRVCTPPRTIATELMHFRAPSQTLARACASQYDPSYR